MRIALVLNKPNREMAIMNAIRREVLKIEPDALIRIFPYDGVFTREVVAFRPDVVMTFPLTSKGLAWHFYLLKFLYRTRIACFRAEGIVDPNSPQNIATHAGYDSYGKNLVDAEIFWGPGPARLIGDELLRQGKISSAPRVRTIGYPRLEQYFGAEPAEGAVTVPGELLKRIELAGRNKTILVATGFHFANYTREMIFMARDLDAENRCDELLATIEEVKLFRAGWIAAIESAARENPELLFIVKKHPIENRQDYEVLQCFRNVAYVWEDVDIAELVQRSGLFLHYGSTSLADAYLAGTPAVYVHGLTDRCKNWFPDLGWPSARAIPVDRIPALIREYRSGAAMDHDADRAWAILEYNFNVIRHKEYRPSRGIAELLVAREPAQRVHIADRHVISALARYGWLQFRTRVGSPVKQFLLRLAGIHR